MRFKILVAVVMFFAQAANTWADVAPDPGYVQHEASLILETNEDLSAYRFFIESPIEIEEIKITSGQQTVIDAASRGGGAGKFGKVVAIPITSLTAYGAEMSPDQLQQLKTALSAKKVPGSVDLLSHSFRPIVRESDVSGYRDPVYNISTDNIGIKATLASGGRPLNVDDGPSRGYVWWAGAVFGGLLLMLAAGLAFVWLIRRSSIRT